MVASTDIKFYVHSNNNAPQLQNAYGSMIGVLDACLVNGISLGAVSLTAAGIVVTALFSTTHNLMQHQVIRISGASQSEFNGDHRITNVLNNQSVTFELISAPSINTATGPVVASIPPLGFEKPFFSVNAAGGGRAAYRSTNLDLINRPFLRVVDERDAAWSTSYAKFAKVGIVDQMTDINTLSGHQSPFDASSPEKNWVGVGSGSSAKNGWMKWLYASYTSQGLHISEVNANEASPPSNGKRDWVLIGTGDSFIIAVKPSPDAFNYIINGFGKFKNHYSADFYNNYLSGVLWHSEAYNAPSSRGNSQGLVQNIQSNMIAISGKWDGTAMGVMGTASVRQLNGSGQKNTVKPISEIGEIVYTDVDLFSDNMFRGRLPFVKWLYQEKPFSQFDFFADSGSVYLAINIEYDSRLQGQVLLQVAGDL